MGKGGISRRDMLKAGLAGALALGVGGEAIAQAKQEEVVPDDEFIHVAPDHWTFESKRTHRKYIPFGSNLVLTSKEDLNIFGPRYETARYDRILEACEGLRINLLKVFLPYYAWLPDPQVPGEVHIAPGYLNNLDDFLNLSRKHHIRAEISLSEWGGSGLKWWQEGGDYFGRYPWKSDVGIDSHEVLTRFWQVLAAHLRDNPTVFSYTPIVEWSMPDPNLTAPWSPAPEDIGLLKNAAGVWYWRHWLLAKYGSVKHINESWGTSYANLDEIPLVNYAYDYTAHRYADPDTKVLDYQNFREWGAHRFFRPQIETIRAMDPNHMVTISNHMRHWDLWEGAAKYFTADTASEEKHMGLDYVTHHANYDESMIKKGYSLDDIVHEVILQVRFSHAGKSMPVIIEEYTFAAADPERNAEGQAAIVRGTVGHAFGWTTWYLQYPAEPGAADSTHRSAWLNADFTPTPWGEQASAIHAELEKADMRRKPAKRSVKLIRAVELVPKKTGTIITLREHYDATPQPTDFLIPHERDLDIRLPGDTNRPDGK